MLMEVKNQIKVMVLSVKYNIMKQMTNKVTFITNIVFMILNNASFIVQWIILFNLKNEIGGYTIREVVLLWGIAASTYGIAHIVFCKAFDIPELIINGKLDTFLVQPKNVFLGVLTSDTKISAIGDLIYGYICLAIYGIIMVSKRGAESPCTESSNALMAVSRSSTSILKFGMIRLNSLCAIRPIRCWYGRLCAT